MNREKVVIVGGGTAGVAIANRLQSHFDVTVIEKSEYKKYPWIYRVPLMVGILFRKMVLTQVTKREFKLADGRKIPFYESNLFGGASVMNGAVHVFGFKSVWEKALQKFNISYDELIKSNDELYSFDLKQVNKISLMLAPQNIIDDSFITTLNKRNIALGDMGYSEDAVCGPIQNTVRKYFRTSVLSLLKKTNFNILLAEKVESILFDESNQVQGVKTNKGVIKANYVILSAGVIRSCDLMLGERDKKNISQELDMGRNPRSYQY